MISFEEIIAHFKKSWLAAIRSSYPSSNIPDHHIKDSDIAYFLKNINDENATPGFRVEAVRVSKWEGLDDLFWERVLKGDYALYCDKFPVSEEIEIDGQKFMI